MSQNKDARRLRRVTGAVQEMYRRANEWRQPYDDFPRTWTREASLSACPLLAKILKLLSNDEKKT